MWESVIEWIMDIHLSCRSLANRISHASNENFHIFVNFSVDFYKMNEKIDKMHSISSKSLLWPVARSEVAPPNIVITLKIYFNLFATKWIWTKSYADAYISPYKKVFDSCKYRESREENIFSFWNETLPQFCLFFFFLICLGSRNERNNEKYEYLSKKSRESK